MAKIAFLEYIFMFDPSTTFSHLHEFENALAKFFAERGLEAERVDNVRGQASKGIFYIRKKEGFVPEEKPEVEDVKTFKEIMQRFIKRERSQEEKKFSKGGKPLKFKLKVKK